MTRDERRVGGGHLFDEVNRIEHALDRSAIGLIGEGIAEIAVEVFDIDHIGLAEPHDGVAGGVRRHHRDQVHSFAVHVEGHGGLGRRGGVVAINPHRNAGHVGRRCRLAVGTRRRTQHLCAQIVLREDQRPLLCEEGVGAGMVGMNMRVDHDLDRCVGERPDRCQCLFGHLSVLGIHHQDAIRSEERHHPATGRVGVCRIKAFRTMQHKEIRRHLCRHHDRNLVPGRLVALRKRVRAFSRCDDRDGIFRPLRPGQRRNSGDRDHTQQQQRTFFHHSAPCRVS